MKRTIWVFLVALISMLVFRSVSAQEESPPVLNKGVKTSYSIKDSLPIYREKAGQGDIPSQLMMGQIYAMGDLVSADMKQAFYWYQKAADQDNAEAQFKIAEMYLYGQGVEQDLSYAEKWASKSAKQGYAGGEYLLGLLYAEGKGVPEDWKKATIWLCRAAKQGNQQAIDLLDARTLTGEISPVRGGEGIKDWCNCDSSRLSACSS